MRFIFYFIFALVLSLHSYFVFAQNPEPSCETGYVMGCAASGDDISPFSSSCQSSPNNYFFLKSDTACGDFNGQATQGMFCAQNCSCPEGFIFNTVTQGGVTSSSCIPEPDTETPPSPCPEGQVKNLDSGACEAKSQCEYPQLYDSFSNSCYANPNNCAEGAKPNPLEPGTCTAYGETSCPSGWVPVNEGLNCAPDPSASSSGNASSGAPASSSGNASSTPASNPSNPSSTPSTGGDGDGDGSSGSGSGGGGDGSTGGTGGSGSASSSNSSGAGSGNGSGGSGECDPTAKNYLDCISEESGDEGDGLDDINQKDYSLNIGERLQQARDNYTDRLNDIKDDLTQELSVSLGAGSGSLPSDRIELYGQTVEMGIYARKDFFDAIRWIFLAVASVVSLYIVLSKGN